MLSSGDRLEAASCSAHGVGIQGSGLGQQAYWV